MKFKIKTDIPIEWSRVSTKKELVFDTEDKSHDEDCQTLFVGLVVYALGSMFYNDCKEIKIERLDK